MHNRAQRAAQACPFCLVGPVSPVLREHQITGIIPGEEPLIGLQAFTCRQGHVFFVAQDGVADAEVSRNKAASPVRGE